MLIFKRILGVLLLVVGVALILVSAYIKKEITAGKAQVESAQSKVDQGNSLFNLTPATKPIGKEITGSMQNKINAGVAEIAHYEAIAQWCLIGGIICIIAGLAILCFGCRRRRT